MAVLSPDTPIPLYYQLKERLKEEILSGAYRPGTRFPSETTLSAQYGVSRGTVRQALGELQREGFLRRARGKGTLVTAASKFEQSLLKFYSFGREMLHRGLSPRSKILENAVERPPAWVADRLHLQPKARVLRLNRLRLVQGEPYILETLWLVEELCPGLLNEDVDETPLYDLLEKKYGLFVVRAEEYLEPEAVDYPAARLLKIRAGAPVFLITRVSYTFHGRPMELRKSIVRGDKYKFYVELY
ncbi:MAG: GntR family transcriptional regulator [Candidatus Methylomirabilales bacterium]